MNNACKLAVLMLTSTLAACGGGGSGEITRATELQDAGDVSTNPVVQDQSTLNQAIQNETPIFQRSQFSSQGKTSNIVIDKDFDAQLFIDGIEVGGWSDALELTAHPDNRQFTRTKRATDGSAVLYVSLPNDARPDPNTSAINGSLSFSTYGLWLTGNALDDSSDINLGLTTDIAAFVGGIVTNIDGMPATGSATYSGGSIVGVRDSATGMTSVFHGSSTFQANFASSSMTGTLAFDTSRNAGQAMGDITSNDIAISANTFSGMAASSAGQTGMIEGVFTGADAAELVGTIALEGNGSTIHGAFGGAR